MTVGKAVHANLTSDENFAPQHPASPPGDPDRPAGLSAMQGTHQAMMQAWQSGTAVARLDAHTKSMESMVESLKALRPATEALYAGLSADQKLKADQLLGMGCCMM